MNSLRGNISHVITQNHMSLVTIDVQGNTMCSIVLDTPNTVNYLQKGSEVNVLFKETEVVLAIPDVSRISLQNQLKCTVRKIDKGNLLGKVVMTYEGNNITSVVTARAIEQLGLVPGATVIALIKTNEVMLEP